MRRRRRRRRERERERERERVKEEDKKVRSHFSDSNTVGKSTLDHSVSELRNYLGNRM